MDMITEADREAIRDGWGFHTVIPDIVKSILKEAFDEGKILSFMPKEENVDGIFLYKKMMKGEIQITDEMRKEIGKRIKKALDNRELFREESLAVEGTP